MTDYSDLVRRIRDGEAEDSEAADAIEELAAALDEARAENESFYQAGFDTGVKLQHALTKGPKLVTMQAVHVGATTTGECRRCGKPIWAGQWRFGSDKAGWEHMQGECPS